MKTYRIFLVCLLLVACGVCVWYCYSAYNEQRSIERGTLVQCEEYAKEWRG